MFKFLVHDQDKPATAWTVRNAYLLGSDNSAMRADVVFEVSGAAAAVLVVGGGHGRRRPGPESRRVNRRLERCNVRLDPIRRVS